MERTLGSPVRELCEDYRRGQSARRGMRYGISGQNCGRHGASISNRRHRSSPPIHRVRPYALCRFTYHVRRGNALDLPYPAASFGHTLSLLVLMFVPQPEKAAQEIRRATRPGGTVAACTWDRDGMEMSAVFWEEAVRLDPDAEAGSERPQRLNQAGQLAALWHATGLQQVEETVLEIGMDFTSFDDYWQPHLKGVGPSGAYVDRLPPEQRETLRRALQNRLQADRPAGPFSLRAKALAVRGVVPKTP